MITGNTRLIAHIGSPARAFKSPMIYNPYFEHAGIDVVVVPMNCSRETYPALLHSLLALENVVGALVTTPHKAAALSLIDEASPRVRVAASCNAVRRDRGGRLQGARLDGEGFMRALAGKGCRIRGERVLVVGGGGVGSAIAASLADAGVAAIGLFDAVAERALALGERIRAHYPRVELALGRNDPAGYGIVVNATGLGMKDADPLPMDVSRIAREAFVGEVVMQPEMTPFLRAVQARGCRFQVGTDMLFAQISASLEFFGLPSTTPWQLRALAAVTPRSDPGRPLRNTSPDDL